MLSLLIFKRYLFSFRAEALVRKIAWLSVVGVAIGVGSLILVQSVMNRFNSNIEDRLIASEPHIVAFTEANQIDSLLQRARSIKGTRAFAFEIQDVIVRTTDGHFSGAVARGVDAESLQSIVDSIQEIQKESRQSFFYDHRLSDDVVLREGEVLLGSSLAVTLGVFEGDRLVVVPPESLLLPPDEAPNFDKVSVGRKMDLNSADLNATALYYVRGQALGRLSDSIGKRVGIELWAENDEVFQEALVLFNEKASSVQSWQERNAALFYALKLEKFLMGLFLSLSALIAGFSIVSVMALLISQKSKEIGILMAMGMSPKNVHKLFVRVGVMLSGVGLIAGVIWGTALSLYLQYYPLKLLPDIYYDSRISAEVSPTAVVIIVILGFILAYLGALFPVREIRQLSPVEVLKSAKAVK